MTTIAWLEANAPGFSDLSQQEREALGQFCLLWGLFEHEALNGQGGIAAINSCAARWIEGGVLTERSFSEWLDYLRGRYFQEGAFTHRYEHLHLEKSGSPQVVANVLSGRSQNLLDVAAAVLIIVFRYRNNLLHGTKWVYHLREQDQNFENANGILTRAIDINRAMLSRRG